VVLDVALESPLILMSLDVSSTIAEWSAVCLAAVGFDGDENALPNCADFG
jgi:hypothetical protein